MSKHEVRFEGHLGADPEMRYFPNGKAVCNFAVGVNDGYKDKQGEWQDRTIWFRVSVYGDNAVKCNSELRKGAKVAVMGKLTADKDTGGPRMWTAKDGKTRASFEVLAFNVKLDGEMHHQEELPSRQVDEDPKSPPLSSDEAPF